MLVFRKEIVSHPQLYVVNFIKKDCNESLLFIHGGPGFNCSLLEFLIEHERLFESLQYNIILYDQRGCGRSKKQETHVSHQDNIDDLNVLISALTLSKIKIKGLIGHSYGAKLLFDFYKYYDVTLPGVFVGIAESMLTPRLNNLMSDLVYLKKTNVNKYQEIVSKLESNLSLADLWTLTEDLAPIFQANQDRPFQAWANLNCMAQAQGIQKLINMPINQDILMSVRKDIYLSEEQCSVDIESLNIPYLWINGFHDYAMNGVGYFYKNEKVKLFYQSGHYPHIEENLKFVETLHVFFCLA